MTDEQILELVFDIACEKLSQFGDDYTKLEEPCHTVAIVCGPRVSSIMEGSGIFSKTIGQTIHLTRSLLMLTKGLGDNLLWRHFEKQPLLLALNAPNSMWIHHNKLSEFR